MRFYYSFLSWTLLIQPCVPTCDNQTHPLFYIFLFFSHVGAMAFAFQLFQFSVQFALFISWQNNTRYLHMYGVDRLIGFIILFLAMQTCIVHA